MFGGGADPRKMQKMMEQMGIDMDELDAEEVVIRRADGTELVFSDPEVTRMDARGQQTYTVVGDPEEREAAGGAGAGDAEAPDADSTGPTAEKTGTPTADADIPDSDVEIVAQRTGASEAEAREALEETDGDLAAAVERLE